MDDSSALLNDLTGESVKAMTSLVNELEEVGTVVNRAKRLAFPPPGRVIIYG